MTANGIPWRKGSHKISLFAKRNLHDILLLVPTHRKKNPNVNPYLWFISVSVQSLKPSPIFTALVDPCCVTIRLHSLI